MGSDVPQRLGRDLVFVADENLRKFLLDVRVMRHKRKEGHVHFCIPNCDMFLFMRLARWQRALSYNETSLPSKMKSN